MMGFAEKLMTRSCHDYVEALEEERRKIQVFRRELPLCLELVTQAIETCKNQMSPAATEIMHEQSECSEHTSGDFPVLEEFIPLKRSSTTTRSSPCSGEENIRQPDADKMKSDWLRSAQLWNQSPDPPIQQKEAVVEVKRNGGAFEPNEKSNASSPAGKTTSSNPATAAAATSSSAELVMRKCGGKKEGKERDGQDQRKQRRCWSPELHKRFLHALQQLGGSHAATPKQIRELMKVDGLTNDEVKSHLQKYRLHTRRPNSGFHNNTNQQAPQFLVVGGIWVPPADYTSAEATTTVPASTAAIYTPVAGPPLPTMVPPHRKLQSGRGSHSGGGVHSHSPSTSSSTHTTTASRVF